MKQDEEQSDPENTLVSLYHPKSPAPAIACSGLMSIFRRGEAIQVLETSSFPARKSLTAANLAITRSGRRFGSA